MFVNPLIPRNSKHDIRKTCDCRSRLLSVLAKVSTSSFHRSIWPGAALHPRGTYIDVLIRHEDCPYYVGLLKAAELHGSTHQAVMEFQVVTNKRLPQLRIGRSNVIFYFRKEFDPVATGITERKTDTGHMKVSSPELTALDLLRNPHAGGGLDNIATVIADLAERLDGKKLAVLAAAYERSVSRRLGYLLDHFGRSERAEASVCHRSEILTLICADTGSTLPSRRLMHR